MASFVVSLGVPVGQLPATGESVLLLRLGGQWAALDSVSAALWAKALVPVSREVLEQTEGTAVQLDDLVAAGALVVAWDDTSPTSELLDLVPISLSVGRGPSAEDDRLFVVATWAGAELLRLDAADYQVWTRLDGRTSLRRALAAAARELNLPPAALSSRVPALFTALLTCRAIALDAP